MTEIVMTLLDVDAAIHCHFSGLTLSAVPPNVPASPVEVFIEDPDVEEVPNRTYPSISITPLGILPDNDRLDSEDQEEFVDAVDERSMINRLPYRALYRVMSWAKNIPQHDREMMTKITGKVPSGRGVMTVESLLNPPQKEDVWLMQSGSASANLKGNSEETIFRKVWDLVALITIAPADPVVYKKVKEVDWKLYQIYRGGNWYYRTMVIT